MSFLDAWNFFRLSRPIGVAPALLIHGSCFVCEAVMRFFGSTVSSLRTRAFASGEILSHHGEGKSYRALRIESKSAGNSSS